MPSMPFETGVRDLGETWLLLGMTAALAVLLAASPGIGPGWATPSALIGALPLIALMLVRRARRRGSHCLHRSVFMAAAGSIGLLLGARLDFGPIGLIALADWCRALPASGLDAVGSTVALAPWTYAGMLIGCNLGMALSARLLGPAAGRGETLLHSVACNTGMLAGMFLAEVSVPAVASMAPDGSAAAVMFWLMVLGMTAGMWAGWWTARWLARAFRRAGPGREAGALES